LWLENGEPPSEYVALLLCRLYHCTPSELAAQDADVIDAHLACMQVEANIARARNRPKNESPQKPFETD